MKKTLIIAALAAISIFSFAQPRQQPKPFVGVVINPDNSVTFQYKNPKAVKVEVSGEFMKGSAELVEKEGVWSYTTAPLESELYFYSLSVDGMPIVDLNYSVVKDIPRWVNYFIIPGEKGDLYSVQDVPHGTVASRWYDSQMLKMRRRVNIYTPAGYENSKEKLPVYYLLHGNACDENAWLDLGRLAQIMDNLIAQGKAKPMIVVMTNGNPAQQAAPAYFGDTYTNSNTMPGIAQFPDTFNEVIKFVESNYRVIAKKEARAIAGFSMGGGHTFAISNNNPNMFDYIGIFSMAGSLKDPATKQKMLDMKKNGYKLYYLGCGNEDFLWQRVLDFDKELTEAGIDHFFRQTGGGHVWGPWRIYVSEMAQKLFK